MKSRNGQTMAEYALMLAAVMLAFFVFFSAFGRIAKNEIARATAAFSIDLPADHPGGANR